jgi:hypothetical protein
VLLAANGADPAGGEGDVVGLAVGAAAGVHADDGALVSQSAGLESHADVLRPCGLKKSVERPLTCTTSFSAEEQLSVSRAASAWYAR